MDVKVVLVHPSIEQGFDLEQHDHCPDRIDDLAECGYRHPDFWHDAGQDIRGGHTEYQYGCCDPAI